MLSAHVARHIHRQVVHQAAIAQQGIADFGGRKHAGHRHARPQRSGQHALLQDDLFAVDQIGRHSAERYGQVVEIVHADGGQGQVGQHLLQLGGVDRGIRKQHLPAIAQTELDAAGHLLVGLFAAEGQALARRTARQHASPVHARDLLAQHIDRHALGVEPADDGAHAGARDAVDGNAQLLQRLERTDVRQPARTAPGKDETGLAGFGVRRRGRDGLGGLHRVRPHRQTRQTQRDAHHAA